MLNELEGKKKTKENKRKKAVILVLFLLNIGPEVSSLSGLRELLRSGREADDHLPAPAAGSEKG